MWDAPLFSSLVDPLCERKLVGGRGFEPRGLTVPKSRTFRPPRLFSRVLSSFRELPEHSLPVSSTEVRLNYYTNHYMKLHAGIGSIRPPHPPLE